VQVLAAPHPPFPRHPLNLPTLKVDEVSRYPRHALVSFISTLLPSFVPELSQPQLPQQHVIEKRLARIPDPL
jgi:hypothetical protein